MYGWVRACGLPTGFRKSDGKRDRKMEQVSGKSGGHFERGTLGGGRLGVLCFLRE